MNLQVPKGRYVVAVSGGVDSMVLLDLLVHFPGVRLTVAHYDHGMRDDSSADLELVRQVALKHGLPFVYDQGNLGPASSEAKARQARYNFLHTVRVASGAMAIITAHHKDDMLETAIINILRGTGRRGLSSLRSQDQIIRPLLEYDKAEIKAYAAEHHLHWREDSTNQDEKYLRNYVRLKILSKFTADQKKQLEKHILTARQLNDDVESILITQLHIQPALDKIDRHWFTGLSHAVAREVMASWLRKHQVNFDKKTLERVIVAAKTLLPGKRAAITQGYHLGVGKDHLALLQPDR